MAEDEADDFGPLKTKAPLQGKDGRAKNLLPLQGAGLRPKFSFRREPKQKPQAPQK